MMAGVSTINDEPLLNLSLGPMSPGDPIVKGISRTMIGESG
jgi:hypothetical protein